MDSFEFANESKYNEKNQDVQDSNKNGSSESLVVLFCPIETSPLCVVHHLEDKCYIHHEDVTKKVSDEESKVDV